VQDPVLESDPAGYLDFFGYGLDIVSLSTGSGYPNKINVAMQKILIWNYSCTRKNCDSSKSITKNMRV